MWKTPTKLPPNLHKKATITHNNTNVLKRESTVSCPLAKQEEQRTVQLSVLQLISLNADSMETLIVCCYLCISLSRVQLNVMMAKHEGDHNVNLMLQVKSPCLDISI